MDDPNAEVRRRSSGNNNPFLRPSGDLCPINRIPVEILSRLFELVAADILDKVCLWRDQQSYDSESDDEHDVPTPWLPVSQVCRHWYDVAASTPSLWTNVIIPPFLCSSFYRIEKQLERSKDLPLDIRIYLEGVVISYSDEFPSSYIPSFCDLLLTQVARWGSVEVRSDLGDDVLKIFDALFKTPIPTASQLTSVELACPDDLTGFLSRHASLSKDFVLFRSSAPHLKAVSVTGIIIDWNQPWISSATNLTTLKLVYYGEHQCISWVDFATILCGALHLQVLIFENRRFGDVDPAWADPNLGDVPEHDGMTPIKLPELRQLDIYLQIPMMIQLLRRCYMPALTKLTIRPHYQYLGGINEIEVLIAQLIGPVSHCRFPEIGLPLIQRQSRSLLAGIQHLDIRFFSRLSTDSIDSLYGNLKQLTSLTLLNIEGFAFIDLLFTPTGQLSDVKLPRLTALSVLHSRLVDHRVRDICALAWQRKDIGVPLKKLILGGGELSHGKFPNDCLLWCRENLETFYFR